jgi:hypothetical protein
LKQTKLAAVPKKRKPRDRTKFNTAIAGGVLYSRPDLGRHWGLGPVTVKTRVKEGIELGLIVPIYLSDQAIRYRLEDVVKYEEYKRVRGLEALRAQKAKRAATK